MRMLSGIRGGLVGNLTRRCKHSPRRVFHQFLSPFSTIPSAPFIQHSDQAYNNDDGLLETSTACDIAEGDPNYRLGENGTLEYTSTGVQDPRLALFFSLVQGFSDDRVEQLLQECFSVFGKEGFSSTPQKEAEMIHDLFVMAFQTRDCRGGKGERELFYSMLSQMYKLYPETTLKLLPLVPEYGNYKDYFRLLNTIIPDSEEAKLKAEKAKNNRYYGANQPSTYHQPKVSIDTGNQEKFTTTVVNLMASQLHKDDIIWKHFQHQNPNKQHYYCRKSDNIPVSDRLSYCAKWAPRDGRHLSSFHLNPAFLQLMKATCPNEINDYHTEKAYRRITTTMTAAKNVPEIKMCATNSQWDQINFNAVPSKALELYKKAFLNESLVVDMNDSDPEENRKGNRFPDIADRVHCRMKLRKLLIDKHGSKLNAKMLQPHVIVHNVLDGKKMSLLQKVLAQVQWNKIKENVLEKMAEYDAKQKLLNDTAADKNLDTSITDQTTSSEMEHMPINLGKLVPLVDVSDSMCGRPMNVAIALGVLVSEINHPAFRDRVITFESNPKWLDLSEHKENIINKVKYMQKAPWGLSTNIEAAFRLILDVVKTHQLPIEEVPDLIVFSDMQFDQVNGRENALTQLERIKQHFHDAGMEICGTPYPPPKIVFWNLRGDTNGYPAKYNDQNVQMLSGFSPSLLKFVMEGEQPAAAAEISETIMTVNKVTGESVSETVKVKVKPTPYSTLRKVLDDDRYDAIRKILHDSTEGALAHYSFSPRLTTTPDNTITDTTCTDTAIDTTIDTSVAIAGGPFSTTAQKEMQYMIDRLKETEERKKINKILYQSTLSFVRKYGPNNTFLVSCLHKIANVLSGSAEGDKTPVLKSFLNGIVSVLRKFHVEK